MSAFYVAVALCIGDPSHPPSAAFDSANKPIDRYQCDNTEYVYGLAGPNGPWTRDQCLATLRDIHDRGNIVKFCIPSDADVDGFSVDWGEK